MTTFNDIGTALTSILYSIIAAIPRLIAFALILLVGWLIASLLGKAVAGLLRAVKFNELAARAGITNFVQNMGVKTDPAGVVAAIVMWFVRLLALVIAFDALGLPAVSEIIQQFLTWLPNLVVALVILVIAGLLANALGDLVRGATASAGFSNPNLLATIARAAIWGFAIIVAVNQIGVASTLVNTLFMGLVGALALAIGLAFGLGGRETAGQIVQGWYEQGRKLGPKVQRAANAAGQEARQAADTLQHDVRRAANTPQMGSQQPMQQPGQYPNNPNTPPNTPPPGR
ncbi:MAG: small-conductance mechanosensitive ion channel [Chloroflexia bacterium]